MEMKIISTIINPIPDEEGFHVFQCDKCNKHFLIAPLDLNENTDFYCPYCGEAGGYMTFTKSIRKNIFKDHPSSIKTENVETFENNDFDIDKIQELLENLKENPMDVEVLEYSIAEVVNEDELTKYEFICCEKIIKIPFENFEEVKFCPFCKGEILLNVIE